MMNPTWINELLDSWRGSVANFFILSGNISDYAIPDVLFYDYLKIHLKEAGFSKVVELGFHDKETDGFVEHSESKAAVAKIMTKDNIGRPSAVVVKMPELHFPRMSESHSDSRRLANLSYIYEALTSKEFILSKNILIFITESTAGINERFLGAQTRGKLINIDFPNEDARLDYLREKQSDFPVLENSSLTLREVSRLTAGLTLMSIEDILLKATMDGYISRKEILERKTELIRKEYGDVLEIMDSEGFTFNDYAGQEHLKAYHREVIVDPMQSGDLDYVPKGLLYTGPPGTGKTHFARCLAGEAGINFVELKPQNLQDKWVGASEKKFMKALNCIQSITPVGVFIDELDQVFQRSNGSESNDIRGAFFSMMLTVLSEPQNRGKIIWIGATNYPDRIDEALKRTGRLDKKMPFLPPGTGDRAKVLEIYLNKAKLPHSLKKEEIREVALNTEGYTQAELEGIVVKTVEVAKRRRRKSILQEDLLYAMSCMVRIESENLKIMTDLAIKECNDLEFLPDEYRKTRSR